MKLKADDRSRAGHSAMMRRILTYGRLIQTGTWMIHCNAATMLHIALAWSVAGFIEAADNRGNRLFGRVQLEPVISF